MKKLLYIVIFSFIIISINATPIGEWKALLGYHDAKQVVVGNKIVYVLTYTSASGYNYNNNLYSYNIEDTSVSTYSKADLLNDRNIVYITYSDLHRSLIIVYDNSNIDLIINDRDIYNISDFKNKIMTEDKTLNNIYLNGDYAYLCTNFGIVILNIAKKEITTSYILKKEVYNCIFIDNKIIAATNEGIYVGDTNNNKNLLDTENWEYFSSDIIKNIVYFDNTILGYKENNGIYKYDLETKNSERLIGGTYSIISITGEKLIIGNNTTLNVYDKLSNSPYNITPNNNFYSISYDKSSSTFWCASGSEGLNAYKHNTEKNELEIVTSNIIPESPKLSLAYGLNFTNNRLLIAGGQLSSRSFPGSVFIYNETEDSWINFENGQGRIVENRQLPYINITAVAEDPRDSNHHFASSMQGVYEFQDGKFVNLYTIDNSSLETRYPDRDLYMQYEYVWTDGLIYDNNNNLWVFNENVETLVHVLTNQGEWKKFYYDELPLPSERQRQMEKPIFDSRNWLWAAGVRATPGVFCLNTNNDVNNQSKHQHRFITNFLDSDGSDITPSRVYCVAEDKNGTMWVGTNKGPLILNNSSNIFNNKNEYFTQIKVPRNDGTNLADLLLENESIFDIKIDGANRKWIATENSGVYLLSEDGLETIHHFTKDNSPLFSNTVTSIAINPKSGVIYMGTEGGLIAYRSDATEPTDSFSEEAYAFPNPVYSDYEGVITVTGMVRDSDVKIVDTAGNLVYSGTSLGGQFTWNGKNRTGKRVASGVYFVIAANSEGKEGIITKILMIK